MKSSHIALMTFAVSVLFRIVKKGTCCSAEAKPISEK